MLAKCSVLPRGRRASQLASTEMLAQGPTRCSVHPCTLTLNAAIAGESAVDRLLCVSSLPVRT